MDNDFNSYLLDRSKKVFMVLSLSISEEISRYSKILAFAVLCNFCYKDERAQQLFRKERIMEKLQLFMQEEKEHFSREELHELKQSLERVIRKDHYVRLFEDNKAGSTLFMNTSEESE